jgi:hypothetical protein
LEKTPPKPHFRQFYMQKRLQNLNFGSFICKNHPKSHKKQPKNSHLLCLFVRRPGSDAASILEFIAKNGKKMVKKWLKNG